MNERINTVDKKPETKSQNSAPQIRRKTDSFQSMSSPVDRILFLQRTIGNQAVGRLIKSGALQAKLRIGQPGDVYEQEADRVADQVMRMPEPMHRKCSECEDEVHRQPEKEEEEILKTKEASNQTPQVTPELESSISALKGGGQPLPESTRAFFEPRFEEDFSQVRVHTDAKAAEAARAVNAEAYTVGQNVVFGSGQYAPGTWAGQKLMAHELVHVMQQQERIMDVFPNSSEMTMIETPAPYSTIQRQFITPLAQGGGYSGLMERDRRRTFGSSLVLPVPGLLPVSRPLPFVVMKRNNIKFSWTVGTDYGHWWTEIDGIESYGWWPDHCPVTVTETLFGTGGDLNGVKGCGGAPTTDPHHGETPDSMFNPILTVPKTDAMVRSDIRDFAKSYSGGWRWTFGYGQNCRSFQRSLMTAVGLKEP